YDRAIALRETLATDFPDVARYRKDLASSLTSLGVVLAVLGRRADEVAEYRKALSLQNRLAAEFPNVPDHRQTLARTKAAWAFSWRSSASRRRRRPSIARRSVSSEF